MSDMPFTRAVQRPVSSPSGHARQCRLASGPMHRAHCMAEAVHGFLAHRFVTTLAAAAALVAVAAWFFHA